MGETKSGDKTFVIHAPTKKSFEIHTPNDEVSSKPSKKAFIIDSDSIPVVIPETDRMVLFARQKNGYDCGPCFILNTLHVLDISTNWNSISDVRRSVNVSREDQQRQPLGNSDWFLTGDVAESLQSQGINVEPYSIKSNLQESEFRESVKNKVSKGESFVVYSGTGRHFKGIYFDGSNHFLLDSLQESIRKVPHSEIDSLVASAKTSDRPETIGIASRRV